MFVCKVSLVPIRLFASLKTQRVADLGQSLFTILGNNCVHIYGAIDHIVRDRASTSLSSYKSSALLRIVILPL